MPLGGIARRPAQLTPVMSKEVTWEKLTLTVDSGASDKVVPPKFCSWSTIFHTDKVGTEYEVANGQVVHNLGERRCIMKVSEKIAEPNIALQVVEVHKPLLAVSSITAQGHQVVFKDGDDHIALANGEKLRFATSMVCSSLMFGSSVIQELRVLPGRDLSELEPYKPDPS